MQFTSFIGPVEAVRQCVLVYWEIYWEEMRWVLLESGAKVVHSKHVLKLVFLYIVSLKLHHLISYFLLGLSGAMGIEYFDM